MTPYSPAMYGVKKPQYSPYAQASGELGMEFSTGTVAEAFREDVFRGVGSLESDIRAAESTPDSELGFGPVSLYERFFGDKDESRALNKEDWESSDYYREGLVYTDGMTEEIARVRTDNYDEQRRRDTIMRSATGGQFAVGMLYGLGTGIVEPKNMITGVLTAGLGGVLKTTAKGAAIARRIEELGKFKSAMVKAGTEGFVSAAAAEPSARASAQQLQQDYTMADSLLNVGGSVLFSGLFEGARHLPSALRKFRHVDADIKGAAFDTALAQVTEGRAVDVEAVLKMDRAYRAEIDPFDPNVVFREDGAWKAADAFDLGKQTGSRYRNYTPLTAQDKVWLDSVVGEVENAIKGERIFTEAESGGAPDVTGYKGTFPKWFTDWNAYAKKEKGVSTLTREKVRSVAEKMKSGQPLGTAEGKIAQVMFGRAREMREENVDQMLRVRADRRERNQFDVDTIGAREEELANLADYSTSSETFTAASPEAARELDEMLALKEPVDADMAYLEDQVSILKDSLDDEGLQLLERVAGIEAEAKAYASGVDIASNCLTRG